MREPVVIAHRGASGYRPEHTLAGYRLALDMGADIIEPDLVCTRDGVLVARHENELGATTDVALRSEFDHLRTTRTVGDTERTGWFVEDLTLAELKTLRAVERWPDRRRESAGFDGRFEVPTFDEVLWLARTEARRRGRWVGVYPETKHPAYFASRRLRMDKLLVRALRRVGWAGSTAPVLVQSFEPDILRRLRGRLQVPLVQLVMGDPWPTDLAEVAAYADGIGAPAQAIAETDLVARAHAAGLFVHAWTLRDDDHAHQADATAEHWDLLDRGVDGIFCDHPDTAVAARQQWLAGAATRRPA